MKTFKPIALAGACALGVVAFAQDAAVPPAGASAPKPPTVAKSENQTRIQIEHKVDQRQFTAFYANLSQARLRLRVLSLFDPVQARLREYFIAELTGAGLTDSIVFDVDEPEQRTKLLAILERFKSEAKKSGELVKRMAERKAASEKSLSLIETKLVELKDDAKTTADEIAKVEAERAKLKDAISVAEEIAKMKLISGEMGVAKVHMAHPPYAFVATFEPGGKQLYILRAGVGVQISYDDVDYYIDLLKRAPEFKQQLLDGEVRDARIRAEIKSLFEQE